MLSEQFRTQLQTGIAEKLIADNLGVEEMRFVAKFLNANPKLDTVRFKQLSSEAAEIFSIPFATNTSIRTLEIGSMRNQGAVALSRAFKTNRGVVSVTIGDIAYFDPPAFTGPLKFNDSVAAWNLGLCGASNAAQFAMAKAILASGSRNIVSVPGANEELRSYCAKNAKQAQEMIDEIERTSFLCLNDNSFIIRLAARRNAVEFLYRHRGNIDLPSPFLKKIDAAITNLGESGEHPHARIIDKLKKGFWDELPTNMKPQR